MPFEKPPLDQRPGGFGVSSSLAILFLHPYVRPAHFPHFPLRPDPLVQAPLFSRL